MNMIRAMMISLMLSGTAAAQDTEPHKEEGTMQRAGEIAIQPARDVGIDKAKIPSILEKAAQAPYGPPSSPKCRAIIAEMGELSGVLGPDFGTEQADSGNRAGKIAAAGGEAVVNSLIPFRGLVRELSGAAPAERRLQAAIAAGFARRGYLRGLALTRRCRMPR